jgi:gliding motility-associated-like protein
VTSTPAGGTAPYTYLWSNGAVTQNISSLGSGTYSVTVKDANNCTATATTTLTQPSLVSGLISNQTNVSCNGGSDGSVTVVANGGTSPYSYLWSDAQATATATGLAAGNYTVTISDANSCSTTVSLIITEMAGLSITATAANPLCSGATSGSANVTVSGGYLPYTFAWSNGSVAQNAINLAAGSYTVTATDGQNCQITASVTIVTPSAMVITTNTSTNISCFGGTNGSASVNVTGGTPPYTYLWAANPTLNSSTNSALPAGNNSITVTDINGCTATHSITLTEPLALTLSVSSDLIICSGVATNLSANANGGTPAYSYFWNNQTGASSFTVNPTTTTIYDVYTTDANGCISALSHIKVSVYPPVKIQANCLVNTICKGDSAQVFIVASEGNGGPWTITNSTGTIVTSPLYVHPQQTQELVFTASDDCNSTAKDSVLITVIPAPPINIISDKINGCAPLLVHFLETSLNTGQSYMWDFGSPDENNLSLSKNPSHLFDVAGTYNISLTVTSAQGCTSDTTIPNMIEVYPLPEARFTYNPINASIINPLVTFTNYSTGNIGNYWFFGDTDSSVLENPVHPFPNVGSYDVMLVAISDKNCTDTATEVVKISDIYTFYAPSAFSPDKDGKNDVFKVFASGIELTNFKLMIYDRWGELIFQSSDIEKGWDGKIDGKVCQMGTYAWIAVFRDYMSNQKTQSGKVTLIR